MKKTIVIIITLLTTSLTFGQTQNLNNFNLTNVNHITINDPGPSEGIQWLGTSANWGIDVSPLNRSNADGNLNFYGTANDIVFWRPLRFYKMGPNQDNLNILSIAEDANDQFWLQGMFAGAGATGNSIKFKSVWQDNLMFLRGDGNIGIGTASPQDKLDIAGTVRSNNQYLKDVAPVTTVYATNGGSGYRMNVINQSGDIYRLQKDGATQFILKNSGNVGIGTTTPGNKLEVNGTIRSKKVKVEATGWPDYVFAKDYELRTLIQLEAYIKTNQHLPEVPSAQEIEAKGLDLGDMDATLLKKVEELTLYMIEMKKEIEVLKEKNQKLSNEVERVKK